MTSAQAVPGLARRRIRIVKQEPVATTERNASEGPLDNRIAEYERHCHGHDIRH
jgi:hypothetical protein